MFLLQAKIDFAGIVNKKQNTTREFECQSGQQWECMTGDTFDLAILSDNRTGRKLLLCALYN